MSVLPELEHQLVRAAGARGAGARSRAGEEISGASRRRGGWVTVALAGAVAVGVVAVFLAVGARHPHPHRGPTAPAARKAIGTPRPSPLDSIMMAPLPPSLRPGERCPVSAGTRSSTPDLGFVSSLGTGPVRPDIGNVVDLARGRIVLGTTDQPGWFGIEVVWYSLPSYHGPWIVRAIRLSGSGRIQLRQALGPRRGAPRFSISSLKVTSGTTSPGTTWISAPGCYAWQVDGVGFSNLIVFEAVAPHGGR